MILKEMTAGTDVEVRFGDPDVVIGDIAYNSRLVTPGSLFVCIRGMETDGHRFIGEALCKGASAVLVETDYYMSDRKLCSEAGDKVTIATSDDTRAALAYISAAFYGHPSDGIKVIGITGTKGKTTIAYMIRDMLEKAGYKAGLLGTIDYEFGDDSDQVPSSMTTPESADIQKYLRQMADNGCDFAVLEVSSQGLMLHRADCIRFDAGIFTNLGNDHISSREHANILEYAQCKAMLFKMCRVGIGNRDDVWYPEIFKNSTCRRITYSIDQESDYRAENVTMLNRNGRLGAMFDLDGEEYTLSMPGKFSVYNALAAIAVGKLYGLSEEEMKAALAVTSVRGRVEAVRSSGRYRILIDYAHNALSLKNILTTMRMYHPYRLLLLFGCSGNRAVLNRREMGQVAGKYSDFAVITSDNPRYEDPGAIMRQVEEGIIGTGGEYVMIPDRRKAIGYILKMAKTGDIVIIAGKGHEQYQEINGEKEPFDERKIISDILKEMNEQ